MPIKQEKMQISQPNKNDAGDGWVTFDSQRVVKGTKSGIEATFNKLPPGMDISNQECRDINSMPLSLAGSTDVTDDASEKAMIKGYSKKKLLSTDDQYTGERSDHFYEDVGGFCERNNYLDRE